MKKRFLAALLLVLILAAAMVSCNAIPMVEAPTGTDGTSDITPTEPNSPTEPTQADTSYTLQATDESTDKTEKPTEKPTEKATETKKPAPTYADRKYFLSLSTVSPKIKCLGRSTFIQTKGISCDFTASGIEFVAEIRNEFSFLVEVSGNDDAYFTVYIDGARRAERFKADKQTTTEITVDNLGALKKHTVRIIKQTEAQNSISVIKQLNFYGNLIGPAEEREHYIEFLGDSITCGYGNDWVDKASGTEGKAINQDGTQTYAFMTAEHFAADFSMISYSGIGVARGWSSITMKTFFEKASYKRDGNQNYSFSGKRVPDLVVINLGTNDVAKGSTETEFKTEAKALINQVRSSYGKDVNIIWTGGMMEESRLDWAEDVVSELGGEANGLYTVSLYSTQHTGAHTHPTVAEQKVGADKLIAYIESKNLLK